MGNRLRELSNFSGFNPICNVNWIQDGVFPFFRSQHHPWLWWQRKQTTRYFSSFRKLSYITTINDNERWVRESPRVSPSVQLVHASGEGDNWRGAPNYQIASVSLCSTRPTSKSPIRICCLLLAHQTRRNSTFHFQMWRTMNKIKQKRRKRRKMKETKVKRRKVSEIKVKNKIVNIYLIWLCCKWECECVFFMM